MRHALLVSLVVLLSACGTPPKRDQRGKPGPANPPVATVLGSPVPILVATLAFTEKGCRLVKTSRKRGEPDLPVIQGHPIVIVALDGGGEVVARVSLPHPLVARSCVRKNTKRVFLDAGNLRVRLPHPKRIRTLKIVITAGPTEGFKGSFPVLRTP